MARTKAATSVNERMTSHQAGVRTSRQVVRGGDSNRGSRPTRYPRSYGQASAFRAIDRLVPLVADEDMDTRTNAALELHKFGPLGIARIIATMRKTRDATLRIMLVKALAAISDGKDPGVIAAIYDVVAQHEDEHHREAFMEAIPVLMEKMAPHQRARLDGAATPLTGSSNVN